jgi:hypothetical protein
VPSDGYPEYVTRFTPPYSGTQVQGKAPDYFPPSMQIWTSGAAVGSAYGTASQPIGVSSIGVDVQQYGFGGEQYVKDESGGGHSHYTWGAS